MFLSWAATVGAALVLALVLLAPGLLRIGAQAPRLVLVLGSLIGILVATYGARGRVLAFLGIRHFWGYPPVWAGGLLGSVLCGAVTATSAEAQRTMRLTNEDARVLFHYSLAVLAFAVGAALAVQGIVGRKSRRRDATATSTAVGTDSIGTLSTSFQRVASWLATDGPVVVVQDDAFEFGPIARRIAGRLRERIVPAQAVVGPLGGGKTTLRNLVMDELRTSGATEITVVPIELWPYETARAAVEGVIRGLIGALAQDVPVLALRGLPEVYAEAMSAAGGMWSALVRLQGGPASPFEALKKIDEIAVCIGKRYVVWVEDLERFSRGGDHRASAASLPETIEESERLHPIRALLLGLDELRSVSVITATTSLHTRFDIEKIARYVEELPPLPEGQVGRILKTFRAGCRDDQNVIDPASDEVRRELDHLHDLNEIAEARRMLGSSIHDMPSAILAFCTTPRSLKQALRSTLDTWRRLAGEVDFDDALLLSVVRESRPDVFATIREHVDALRRSKGEFRSELLAKEQERAWKAWQEAVVRLGLSADLQQALDQIVEFVFKKYSVTQKPQGLAHRTHADYWARFLAVPDLPQEYRDQSALRAIKEADNQALVVWLEDPQRHRIIESFGHFIATEHLVGLLALVAERRTGESPSTWPDGGTDPPGIIPVWRMWNRRSERGDLDPDVALEHLQRVYDSVVPRSLGLAVKIEHYFAVAGQEVPNVLGGRSDRQRNELAKRHLRDLLVKTYRGQPDAFASALRGAALPTLLWLTWGLDRVRAHDYATPPFEGWGDLAPTILDAARLHPDALLLQLAVVVTVADDRRIRESGDRYKFDPDLAERLFGSSRLVIELFSTAPAGPWTEAAPMRAVLDAAR